jgi:hypothetical protein
MNIYCLHNSDIEFFFGHICKFIYIFKFENPLWFTSPIFWAKNVNFHSKEKH